MLLQQRTTLRSEAELRVMRHEMHAMEQAHESEADDRHAHDHELAALQPLAAQPLAQEKWWDEPERQTNLRPQRLRTVSDAAAVSAVADAAWTAEGVTLPIHTVLARATCLDAMSRKPIVAELTPFAVHPPALCKSVYQATTARPARP